MANVKELNINSTTYDIVGKSVEDQNNSGTPVKVWTGTKAEYDLLTPDANTIYNITDDSNPTITLEAIYPVGSIYIGTMNTCPLSALFGTWTLVATDRVLQGSGTYDAGDTVEAGLPNITGNILGCVNSPSIFINGAFSRTTSNSAEIRQQGGSFFYGDLNFDASRSSSIYGKSSTVQPQAFVVNIWQRTA